MNGILTGFFGAIVEAWAQLRIGKLRVLLSLVGVAAAVAAMTFVIAMGQVSVSAINKAGEKYNGRLGTVTINVNPTGKGLSQALQADDAPGASADASSGSSTGGPAGPGGSGVAKHKHGGAGVAAAALTLRQSAPQPLRKMRQAGRSTVLAGAHPAMPRRNPATGRGSFCRGIPARPSRAAHANRSGRTGW